MWKSLLILIVAVIFIIIVVPLAYIVVGKVKDPVASSVNNNTEVPVFSQNYIPEAAGTSNASSTNPEGFDLALESACDAEELVMVKDDVVDHLTLPANMQFIEGRNFNFVWKLSGEWQNADLAPSLQGLFPVFIKGGKAPETTLSAYMRVGKNASSTCVAYYNTSYGYLHDSGRFVKTNGTKLGWDNTLSILEKGKMTISGQPYYWYMFQDGRISYTDSGQKFVASFNTYKNGISYSVNFLGSKEKNGSYRKMFTTAAEYVAGLRI